MYIEQLQDGLKPQFQEGIVDHVIYIQTLHDALYFPMTINLSELTIVHIEQQMPTIIFYLNMQ